MSVHDRFPHSTAELCGVKAVQFGVLSPDEIVRLEMCPNLERDARGRTRGDDGAKPNGKTNARDLFFYRVAMMITA
jgi:hypothetical protein